MDQVEKKLKKRGHSDPQKGIKNVQMQGIPLDILQKLQASAEHFARQVYNRQMGPHGGSDAAFYNVKLKMNTARHERSRIVVEGTWDWENKFSEGGSQSFTMDFDPGFYGVLSVAHDSGANDWREI